MLNEIIDIQRTGRCLDFCRNNLTMAMFVSCIPWWRHQIETFPRYWALVWGIHRSPVDSPHKDQWRGALMFSLICASTNGWTNTLDAGDLRRDRAQHDVTIMWMGQTFEWTKYSVFIWVETWEWHKSPVSSVDCFEQINRASNNWLPCDQSMTFLSAQRG